jgi:hypothetical protein
VKELWFIYNADSGFFSTTLDIAHKIFSPSTYKCNLCSLTHGHFKVREQWEQFTAALPVDIRYLHKDEYEASYDKVISYPVVLVKNEDDVLEILVDTDELNKFKDLQSLIETIHSRLK